MLVVIIAAVVGYYRSIQGEDTPTITAPVTSGDVIEVVDATGTLQAVTTVQVGTQVSGTIKAVRADFNSRVQRGQVIAELESSLFGAQVEQARASLVRLEAEASKVAVQRRRPTQASTGAGAGRTAIDRHRARGRRDDDASGGRLGQGRDAQVMCRLGRRSTRARSISPTRSSQRPSPAFVISRNVDVGQTVAASMQAPTLFVIARDLAEMQVNASISESDIGRIRAGPAVSFRVDAYPGEVFTGRVSQVRLEPVVQQNVVSYVTTIDVPNRDLKLKPGMTANVTVEIARMTNVLRLPNAALRVRPSDEMVATFGRQPAESEVGRTMSGPPGPSGDCRRARRRYWDTEPSRSRVGLQRWTTGAGAGAGGYYGRQLHRRPRRSVVGGYEVVTSISRQSTTSSTTRSPLLPFGGRPPGGGRGAGAARPPGT